jgi:hypothetical protein
MRVDRGEGGAIVRGCPIPDGPSSTRSGEDPVQKTFSKAVNIYEVQALLADYVGRGNGS